jgi:hypothetical protein
VEGAQRAVGQLPAAALLLAHALQRGRQGLQRRNGAAVLIDDHVQLKVVVLRAEQRLLVLILAVVLQAGQKGRTAGGREESEEAGSNKATSSALSRNTCKQ